jgi:hypothetical protein
MVRLCPGFSVQPVRASGWAGFWAAATQIVWVTRLTNVTRWAPAAAAARAGAAAGAADVGPAGGLAAARLTAAARTSAAGAVACAAALATCAARAGVAAPAVPPVAEHAVTSATAGQAAATSAAIRSGCLFFRPATMRPVLLARDVLCRTSAVHLPLGDAPTKAR